MEEPRVQGWLLQGLLVLLLCVSGEERQVRGLEAEQGMRQPRAAASVLTALGRTAGRPDCKADTGKDKGGNRYTLGFGFWQCWGLNPGPWP